MTSENKKESNEEFIKRLREEYIAEYIAKGGKMENLKKYQKQEMLKGYLAAGFLAVIFFGFCFHPFQKKPDWYSKQCDQFKWSPIKPYSCRSMYFN